MQLTDFVAAVQRQCESRGMPSYAALDFIEKHQRLLGQAHQSGLHYAVAADDLLASESVPESAEDANDGCH